MLSSHSATFRRSYNVAEALRVICDRPHLPPGKRRAGRLFWYFLDETTPCACDHPRQEHGVWQRHVEDADGIRVAAEMVCLRQMGADSHTSGGRVRYIESVRCGCRVSIVRFGFGELCAEVRADGHDVWGRYLPVSFGSNIVFTPIANLVA